MPHVNFSNPTSYAHGNKGSSGELFEYLEKENEGKEFTEREMFFDHARDHVPIKTAQHEIDNNVKGLGKNDQKFYEFSVSFSQKEMNHIAGPDGKINKDLIKDYSRDLMEQYAKNFNRELKGHPLEGKDIKYFAKVETERRYPKNAYNQDLREVYKHNFQVKASIAEAKREGNGLLAKDLEKEYARNGEGTVILPGNQKDGHNIHVHFVVSHKDQSMSMKLSPLAKQRNSKNILNGEKVQVGFNRDNFADKTEKTFDDKFGYSRGLDETYRLKLTKLKGHTMQFVKVAQNIQDPERFIKSMAKSMVKSVFNAALGKGSKAVIQGIPSEKEKALRLAVRRISNVKGNLKDQILKEATRNLAQNMNRVPGIARMIASGNPTTAAVSLTITALSKGLRMLDQQLVKGKDGLSH